MKKVKVIKLEEREDAEVPNNKEVGYFKVGFFREYPEPGKEFLLYHNDMSWPMWHTSMVTEILSFDTFRTKNSVYQIVPFEEEEFENAAKEEVNLPDSILSRPLERIHNENKI